MNVSNTCVATNVWKEGGEEVCVQYACVCVCVCVCRVRVRHECVHVCVHVCECEWYKCEYE